MKGKIVVTICVLTLLIGTTLTSVGMKVDNVKNNSYELNDYDFVSGEFIIKFTENTEISSLTINELNNKYHVFSIDKVFKNAEDTILEHIYKFSVPEDADILSIVGEYSSLPNVVYAEPNYISYLLGVPNDEYFGIQYGLHNTGQIIWENITGTSDADIDAVEAWDIETGSEDIIIAIFDSGVDYTHPDLAANMWENEDEIPDNGIDDDNNGYIDDIYGYDFISDDGDPLDELGHGTCCAGIAAAVSNNGIGISGISWNSKIMAVKVGDYRGDWPRDRYLLSTGIKYAVDNGADVISISMGDYGAGTAVYFEEGVNYAYDNDVVVVASAGNSNSTRKNYPAAMDKVICVAATNQNDERCTKDDWDPNHETPWAFGSNYGNWIDVAAPGNLVYSTMPTYHVTGNDMYNTNTGRNYTQNYTYFKGTSSACPHVASLAALLLSQDHSLSTKEVRKIIRANVDPYDSEEYIGTGRINVHKALTRFNIQPETPETISGKTNGRPGRRYSFSTSATDSDGDDLWYFWDWGDGINSDWLGPYASGDDCEASYSWQQEANFLIKVKVKDGKGGESYWSEEFKFSTSRNKPYINRPILNFIEQHPRLLPILRQLLDL